MMKDRWKEELTERLTELLVGAGEAKAATLEGVLGCLWSCTSLIEEVVMAPTSVDGRR